MGTESHNTVSDILNTALDQEFASHSAYETVAQEINKFRPPGGRTPDERVSIIQGHGWDDMVNEKLLSWSTEWQEGDILLNYFKKQKLETSFVLVATPNTPVSGEEISSLGLELVRIIFNRTSAFKHGDIDKYSPEQLSRHEGKAPILFSLMPVAPDRTLSSHSVAKQIKMMKELQAEFPDLHLHSPTALEVITYWHTVKALGKRVLGCPAVIHLDLAERSNGRETAPVSLASDTGIVLLSTASNDAKDVDTRLSLGYISVILFSDPAVLR